MPNERTIPTVAAPTVSTFTLLSDGAVVPREHQVLSIVVQREVNRLPSATLIIRDGSAAQQTFDSSNSDFFIPGRKLEVKAGYRGTEDTIFQGVVVSHGLKVREQNSVLMVSCKDAAFKLTIGPRNRYFRDQKDSDILEEIITNSGLDAEVETTTEVHAEVVQYDCTDWDFILTRADAIGHICRVENGKLRIGAPDLTQPPALTLAYGATLYEFDAEMDVRHQYKSVQSVSWGAPDQELRESEEASLLVPQAGNLSADELAEVHGLDPLRQQHTGSLPETELQSWTKARLLKSRLAKLRGRAAFQGTAALLPGQIVELRGVGDRFNGNVYVSAVRHEISEGNWRTNVQFGLDPDWFVERYDVTRPRAGGLIPPVSGLQIGIVTQLEQDPAGEDRIMVRIPVIDADDEGIWARIATLDAGDTRGSFFRPEIDDEVVVGFLNDDPRHPVVLGGLNSSAKPAPLTAADDNHEKGFVTRAGMKVLFNDEHQNILLETPDGNSVHLSGEDQAIILQDQHGNKIVMDRNGISIESIKDLQLKASVGLTGEGSTVEIKGQGTAEFSAGGSTTIKGGVVQIN